MARMELWGAALDSADAQDSLSAVVASQPRLPTVALDRERDVTGRLATLHARTQHIRLGPTVSLPDLARATRGLLPEDLDELVRVARLRAARRSRDLVHDQHLVESQDFSQALQDVAGVADSKVLEQDQVWILAYHEAGHALLEMLVPGCVQRGNVSIFPSVRTSASERDDDNNGHLPGERSLDEERLIVLLGGLAAEWIVYGAATDDAWVDLDEASGVITKFAESLPTAERQQPSSLVAGLQIPGLEAEEYYRCSVSILRDHRVRLDMLARALVEQETLDAVAARAAAGLSTSGRVSRLNPIPADRLVPAADSPQVPAVPVMVPPLVVHERWRHVSVRVISGGQRARYRLLTLVWGLAAGSFWVWWLGQAGSATPGLYWVQTVMLFYQTTFLPTVYWSFVGKMRKPVEVEPSSGLSVALITLCVPTHESLGTIRGQLEAMQHVAYPHESWILDEGGSADVRALAGEYGVRYFTRRGVECWNQRAPPFQEKTKAGNVNAWLDYVASLELDYDVFVQFDIDHRPRTDYLERTLGYFRDSEVAWVQAPSVCGNLEKWAARGLTEQDLVFHGPLQMGFYGSTRTPFIIGSHTSYRMAAVRGIGGFQPTRAEDHLDTVLLAAHGYKGVFVPDLIAVGDGPDTFATYLRQQFAWAYSMIQIFFQHTPKLVWRYTPKQAFQFLFCQSWYTLWSISMAVLWAMPTLALLIQRPIALVKLTTFLLYFLPVLLASSLMWCETRRWFQPGGVKLSWRGVLLGVARWPVIVWALLNVVFRVQRPYMITPKGVAGAGPRGFSLYGPGMVMALVPLGALWIFHATGGDPRMRGYYLLALANSALGLLLVATTVALEVRDVTREAGARHALRMRSGVIAGAIALTALLVVSTIEVWTSMLHAIS